MELTIKGKMSRIPGISGKYDFSKLKNVKLSKAGEREGVGRPTVFLPCVACVVLQHVPDCSGKV